MVDTHSLLFSTRVKEMKRKSFRNSRNLHKKHLNYRGDFKPSFYNETKGRIAQRLGCYPPIFYKVKYPKQLIHWLQKNAKIETFNYGGRRFIRQFQQFRYMRKGLRTSHRLDFYYKSYLFWLRFYNDELTESYGIIDQITVWDKEEEIIDGYDSYDNNEEIRIPKTNAEFVALIESFVNRIKSRE
jgi:hypothetical protein